MNRIDPCSRCGSTNFELEGGVFWCENGHDQQTGPVTAADEQDYGLRGKVIRKKEQKVKQKISKVLRGRKAYQLFLQAWQYILWKQCHVLIHAKGLPTELWTIVRDLWALKLSKLTAKLEENETDIALADFSGFSSSEVETSDSEADKPPRFKTTRTVTDSPLLIETIALNYLGILMLRCPVSLDSVFRWIKEEDIPFIRAIRHVPSDMTERLPGEYQKVFETTSILETDILQSAIYRTATIYGNSFGMKVPSLNYRPVLLQYIESLALPLDIYPMVNHLNTITKFDFAYPNTITSRRSPVAFPEAQLMSLVVIATKLLYPLRPDSARTHPKDLNAPGTLQLDWPTWVELRNQTHEPHLVGSFNKLERGTQMSLKDTDILKMSDNQLDEYMHWYQRTWTRPERPQESINREILAMFSLKPLPDPPSESETQQATQAEREMKETRIKGVQQSLKFRRPISSESEADSESEANDPPDKLLRPGWQYQQFKSAASLTGVAKIFHQDAANAACLSLESLVYAVNHTEQIIVLWKRAKRRAELWGEEMNVDAEIRRSRTTSQPGASQGGESRKTRRKDVKVEGRSDSELREAMGHLDV